MFFFAFEVIFRSICLFFQLGINFFIIGIQLVPVGPSSRRIQSGYNTSCVGVVTVRIGGDRLWCFFLYFSLST
jgi:hypothetical protein